MKPTLTKRCVICNAEFTTKSERRKTDRTECSAEHGRRSSRIIHHTPEYRAMCRAWRIANPDKVKEHARRAKLKKEAAKEKEHPRHG